MPRPTEFSNDESDRKLLSSKARDLKAAVADCEDKTKVCFDIDDCLAFLWNDVTDIFEEFCRRMVDVQKSLRQSTIKCHDLLMVIRDLGILDQHDPLYQ